MSNRDENGARAVEVIAQSVGAAVVAGAALSLPGAAVVAAVPPLLGWAIDLGARVRQQRADARLRVWLENLGSIMEFGSAEDAQIYINDNVDEPWVYENLMKTFRDLMEAVDDAVIPSIARLTSKYFFLVFEQHLHLVWRHHSKDISIAELGVSYIVAVCIVFLDGVGFGRLRASPFQYRNAIEG